MSNTPEIELEQGFPECPNCFAEIDTWAAEKRAIDKERERIIALLETDEVLHDIWWVVYRDIEPFPERGRLSQWEIAEVLKDRLGLIKGETK